MNYFIVHKINGVDSWHYLDPTTTHHVALSLPYPYLEIPILFKMLRANLFTACFVINLKHCYSPKNDFDNA